jgi:hypothetical protein
MVIFFASQNRIEILHHKLSINERIMNSFSSITVLVSPLVLENFDLSDCSSVIMSLSEKEVLIYKSYLDEKERCEFYCVWNAKNKGQKIL